jgi:uncharacterized ubiquitin-like protein YukD
MKMKITSRTTVTLFYFLFFFYYVFWTNSFFFRTLNIRNVHNVLIILVHHYCPTVSTISSITRNIIEKIPHCHFDDIGHKIQTKKMINFKWFSEIHISCTEKKKEKIRIWNKWTIKEIDCILAQATVTQDWYVKK